MSVRIVKVTLEGRVILRLIYWRYKELAEIHDELIIASAYLLIHVLGYLSIRVSGSHMFSHDVEMHT